FVEAINDSTVFAPDVREDATDADVADAERDLLRDRIKAFVVLPKGLSQAVDEGRRGKVRVVVDGSDTFTAPTILGELGMTTVVQNGLVLARKYQREGTAKTVEDGLTMAQPIELLHDFRFNPDLKSQSFVMPGVIGLILQLLTVIVMATSIARERE